jgi:ketosteroid isomerase-like protein
MRNWIALLFIVPPFAGNAQTKETKAVAEQVENLRTAMISADIESLSAICHDSLSYGHSNGFLEGKTGFLGKIKSGESDFVSIKLTEQYITVLGKTAVVRHILQAETNDNGKPGKVNLKILLVFVKAGDQWRLLARQAVRIA